MKPKLITLHQPWASLATLGLKGYETREWDTSYRGPLLIHAAARKMRYDEVLPILYSIGGGGVPQEQCDRVFELLQPFIDSKGRKQTLPLGQILSFCDLTDCKEMKTVRGYIPELLPTLRIDNLFIEDQTVLERTVGLWKVGRFAFKLENARVLPEAIAFKSRQGKLLDVPSDVIEIVNHQILYWRMNESVVTHP